MKTTFSNFKTCLPLFCFLLFVLISSATAAPIFRPTQCIPPMMVSEYAAQYHQTYPGGGNVYDLTQLIHSRFDSCKNPPPVIGGTTFHGFNSQINATLRINSGLPMSIFAPCQSNVRVTKTGQNGNISIFQTEMLQLDIQGGNLPANFRVRESPTFQSLGTTTIEQVAGGFLIDSYFDIRTELSTDNGVTWIPSAGAGHVVLRNESSGIPTLSQWGLIILGLLLLSMGMVLVRKKEMAVAGFENATVTNYFLLDKKVYLRVLSIVLLISAVCLVAARFYYGTLSLTDILGTFASSLIVAYIAHLFVGNKTEDRE